MNRLFSEYIENVKKISESSKISVSPEAEEDKAIEAVRKNSANIFSLHARNDEILQKLVFSKNPENMSAEEAYELAKFADTLGRIDYPLFYRAYLLCSRYAELKGDKKLFIRSCYWMSIALYYLKIQRPDIGIDLFTARVAEYINKVIEFIPEYDSFDDEDTKGYLIRSHANRRLVPEYFSKDGEDAYGGELSFAWYTRYRDMIHETVKLVTDPEKQKGAPGLPWDTYLYITAQALTSQVSKLRSSIMTDEEYDETAKEVLMAAEYVYAIDSERAEKTGRPISAESKYRYFSAKYHSGLITPSELMQELADLYSGAAPNDFTSAGIFANLRVPLYMQFYSEFLDNEGHFKFDPIMQKARDGISDYLTLIPRNQYANEVSLNLRETLLYRSKNHTTYRQQVLEYILACHPPTYIHSHMVAWLAETLFLELCDKNPECLRGILGVENVETIVSGKERFAITVRQCGLYHDIGKCMIIDHIGNYSRSLTDEEFDVIKIHPQLGSDLLKKLGGFEDHASVALLHHRYSDGSAGYPENAAPIPRRVRKIVDIITVADSLDAGTDNIGRCFNAPKDVKTLCSELRQGSGTRYSPEVTALFDDEEFCDLLEEALEAQRRDIYYETYAEIGGAE